MRHDLLTNLLAAVYLYFECMMIGTITANAIAARYVPKKDKDFIIPGCATRKDGTPTSLLRGRLDLPPDFAEAQRAETEKAPVFVLSGGKGADECISEAECMRRYLSAQGVPEEQLLLEDNSTDTAENMAFSKKLILDRVRPGQDAPRAIGQRRTPQRRESSFPQPTTTFSAPASRRGASSCAHRGWAANPSGTSGLTRACGSLSAF